MIEGFGLINDMGKRGEDFLFVISYDKSDIRVYPLNSIPSNISCTVSGKEFGKIPISSNIKYRLKKYPIDYKEYLSKFNKVQEYIALGDTYLLNLTQPTLIESSFTLKDFYLHSKAPYKIYVENEFVCFSPECFIEIKNNTIYTHPMKGTIDASIDNAKEKILTDSKEFAEHTMIVDLMRNDLNMI